MSSGPELGAGYNLRGVQGRVIDGLGRAIVGGRYPPGTALPREAELIAEYGVSRTSLREAMKVLAAKGLLEIRQKSGTRVKTEELWNRFDSDLFIWAMQEHTGEQAMRDLIELREVLEPAAARLASKRAATADLDRLNQAIQRMADHTESENRYAESDVIFHTAVFAASHNAFLQRFGTLVADFLRLSFRLQQRALDKSEQGRDLEEDTLRHRAVYEAIRGSDEDRAERAMAEVVLDGKRDLLAAIEATDRSVPLQD